MSAVSVPAISLVSNEHRVRKKHAKRLTRLDVAVDLVEQLAVASRDRDGVAGVRA
mgnify:CR=1 FL=1